MRLGVTKLSSFSMLLSICLAFFTGAGMQEAIGDKAKYGLKPEDYALPSGAIGLKIVDIFPTEEDAASGHFLSQPSGFCVSPSGILYVSDVRNSEIYVYDLSGKFLKTLGRFGQGPAEFMMPKEIALIDDKILIRDIGNKRLQIIDQHGGYQGGFKLFRDYLSMVTHNGRIYAIPIFYVPPTNDRKTKLIDVIDLEGRVEKSFGGLLDVNIYDYASLNCAHLALGMKNDLWVAFERFPIVHRYSLEGELLAEYRYRYGIVDKKDAFNKRMMAQRTKLDRIPYYLVNSAICKTSKGLYLLGSSEKRLDIILMDDDGRIIEFFWFPLSEPFWCFGLFVNEKTSGVDFYVLNMSSAQIWLLSYSSLGGKK